MGNVLTAALKYMGFGNEKKALFEITGSYSVIQRTFAASVKIPAFPRS